MGNIVSVYTSVTRQGVSPIYYAAFTAFFHRQFAIIVIPFRLHASCNPIVLVSLVTWWSWAGLHMAHLLRWYRSAYLSIAYFKCKSRSWLWKLGKFGGMWPWQCPLDQWFKSEKNFDLKYHLNVQVWNHQTKAISPLNWGSKRYVTNKN